MSENPEIIEEEPTLKILLKRGRGRPRKSDMESSENPEINEEESTLKILPKRGRGRPRKSGMEISENPEIKLEESKSSIPLKRRRGRPRKSQVKMSESPEINEEEPISNIPLKRGRGRPRKSDARMQKTPPLGHLIHKNKRRVHPGKPRKGDKIRRRVITLTNTPIKKTSRRKCVTKTEKRCAVSTCDNSSKDPGNIFSFHTLPNDARRSIWMYAAGITSVRKKRVYICSNHFKEKDFYSTELLHQTAIPSLHLPSSGLINDDSIFNDLLLNPSDIIQKLHNTIKELTWFKKKHKEKYIDFQMSLYLKHSSAYKLLENPLQLLSPLQLKKEIYNSPINFIRFSNLINKKLLMMNYREKICFVTCVQIAIEPKLFYCSKSDKLIGLSVLLRNPKLASSVHILIAHGVYSEWHIPLDITFITHFNHRHNTKHWIEQTIKTYSMLHVKGFAWFPNLAEYLHPAKLLATLETSKPEFNKLNCHFLCDIQFLLKLLYFHLKSKNYYFGELNAKLDDLKKMYEIDSKRKYPLAPDLSASSVNLSTFDQLTYKHIKEVFSEETATALKTYAAANLIEAEGTAIFVGNIALFIKLFDSNNKLTNEEIESIVNKVKSFLKTIKHDHTNHFIDSLFNILNIYLEDPEFFSISSKYLLNNYVHTFVDNILNNCFGEKPTSMDIENAYRRSFVENLLKPIKKNVNFEEALNLAQKELSMDPSCFLKANNHIKFNVKLCDDKLYMLEREDRVLYVAGYILKKCYLYHNCDMFKDYVNNVTEDEILLSKCLSKEIDEGKCMMLKKDFVEFIEVLEMVFLSQFVKLAMKDFFIKNLLKLNEMQAINFTSACFCFPSSYARELFVRIRVDYVLSYNNMHDDTKLKLLQNISL